jgi:hypothetical protein
MEFLQKNFAILLAFILPIILISVVALSAYLPSLFLSTNYNFIYVSCTDGNNYNYLYNCDNYLKKRYSVINNKIAVYAVDSNLDVNNNVISDTDENYVTRIFLHDTAKNESKEISFEEAQNLTLNSLLTSPDDVTVSGSYDRSGGDFFFIFGRSSGSYDYYLTKGNSKKKLNLINDTRMYYYQKNFQFLGWVLPGRN